MPYGVLKFRLPEEREEFKEAQHAGDYKSVLWDLDQFLRSKVKHGNLPPAEHKSFQEARDKLHELLTEHEVDL